MDDHLLAARIAGAAAELLLSLRRSSPLRGKALGEAGDREANRLILDMLEAERPADGVLSEETAPDPMRLRKDRVWIVDPLDGTREYAEASSPPRADWAVHVALAVRGAPHACAVAIPDRGETRHTGEPPPLARVAASRLRILVSRTRPPAVATHLARRLQADLLPMGSAGAKTMAVIRGDAHAYVHAGGQFEWDSCAPAGLALAAGLHVSRLDGSACTYNRPDPFMPDLLVCRRELAAALLAAIEESAPACL